MFSIIISYKTVLYWADINDARDKNFITITGTVVGYKCRSSSDDGTVYFHKPIFKISGSDDEIALSDDGTLENRKYIIIYLKHSREGIISATVDDKIVD